MLQRIMTPFDEAKNVVLPTLLFLVWCILVVDTSDAFHTQHTFTSHSASALKRCSASSSFGALLMTIKDRGSSTDRQSPQKLRKQSKSTVIGEELGDEKPLEPVGTQFFGGSMEKEALFDEAIEDEATSAAFGIREKSKNSQSFTRFFDLEAFPNARARDLGEKLQRELNEALYEIPDEKAVSDSLYDIDSFEWVSPFNVGSNVNSPLERLQKALDYYRRADAAVISARFITDDECVVRWLISLQWPNAWEARVTLSGKSNLTLTEDGSRILKQEDSLDNGGKTGTSIIQAIAGQILPRFWDLYHIGMTPSAEVMQRLPLSDEDKRKGILDEYDVFEVAPRLVLKPSLLDSGGRAARTAQCLPNEGFTCDIKTAGSKKQRYVPTGPLEVRINAAPGRQNRITWVVPVPAETASNQDLSLSRTVNDEDESEASISYTYEPRRRVATVPFAGFPQDEEVAKVRQRLYNNVIRDGWKLKMDEKNRPIFFFLLNNAKCCFTEEGLGMTVYEDRPSFLKSNEIGLELEI